MTRVYLLGTRTNSFCICCSIYQKMTNLTMLFNVLLTTFTFSFFLFFFLMASGHASNNPFQVVYFCFPIKFTIYPDLKIVFSQLSILEFVIPLIIPIFVLRTGCSVFDRIFFSSFFPHCLDYIWNVQSCPLLIPQSTEEHQPMPLNVHISSNQICSVIKIKALSGIKGFYFEVHTMVLNIGLALYCSAPLLTTKAMCCLLLLAQHNVEAASCLIWHLLPLTMRFRWFLSVHQKPWCK